MSKVALVTGGSRGIGHATALRLIEAGDDITTVVLWDRGSDHPNGAPAELVSAAQAKEKRLIHEKVDLTDLDAIPTHTTSLFEKVGNIDVLVNNAGYTNPVPVHQVEMADFEHTMAVNLYAPFLIIQSLLHAGNTFELIVNIASTAGIKGRSGWLTYSASKAALINMSQVLREELAIYGTRVACISPGRTATALRRQLAPNEDPETIMQPEHVAEVIATLYSPVGRYLDSENLVIRL